MRYLLHKSQAHELKARQEYLFDIFYLYFLPGKSEGSYIPLIPVGTKGPDVSLPDIQTMLPITWRYTIVKFQSTVLSLPAV